MTVLFALAAVTVTGLAVLVWPAVRVLTAARDLHAEVRRARGRLGLPE
ncbi:hypothetical protein AB0C14_17985 [Microbispora hainanensis]